MKGSWGIIKVDILECYNQLNHLPKMFYCKRGVMKRESLIFSIIILLSLCLSACVPLNPAPVNQQVSDAYIKTAVASTLVAERAKEAGASLSFTSTPDGTLATDGTQETEDAEGDGDENDTEDPQPTPENPWMLQSWCLDHPSHCVKYAIQNKTDSWLQIELKESATGVTGFFSVRSKSISKITLIPGQYAVKYTWWCDGEVYSSSVVKSLGSWVDIFTCPQG